MGRVKSNLKNLVDANGKSIREVAKEIDYRFESVRQLYNDDSRQFPRDLLVKLCAYFSCDIGDILKYVEDEETPPA